MDYKFQQKSARRLFLKQLIGAFAVVAVMIILYTSNISNLKENVIRLLPYVGMVLFGLVEALIVRKDLKSPEADEVRRDNIIGYYVTKFQFYSMIGVCIFGIVSLFVELLSS